jgi:hypothetical protein
MRNLSPAKDALLRDIIQKIANDPEWGEAFLREHLERNNNICTDVMVDGTCGNCLFHKPDAISSYTRCGAWWGDWQNCLRFIQEKWELEKIKLLWETIIE